MSYPSYPFGESDVLGWKGWNASDPMPKLTSQAQNLSFEKLDRLVKIYDVNLPKPTFINTDVSKLDEILNKLQHIENRLDNIEKKLKDIHERL